MAAVAAQQGGGGVTIFCPKCDAEFDVPLDVNGNPVYDSTHNPDCSMCGYDGSQGWGDNYDPSPYCQYCGAMRQQDCNCGPIAANN